MPTGLPLISLDPDQQSERTWLSALLDEIPMGIGIFDPEGRLCHANRSFAENNKSAFDFVDPVGPLAWKAYTAAGQLLCNDLSAYVAALAPAESITDLIPSQSDKNSADLKHRVVEVDRLEEVQSIKNAQQKEESRFKCFADHSSNAIMIADVRSGNIDYLSPAAERIWSKHAPIETISQWEESIHPDDRPFALERRGLVSQGLYQRFQYRIIDRNGQTARHVRETSFPMPSESGELECIGGIVEDMSPEMPIYLVQASASIEPAVLLGLHNTAHHLTTFSCQSDLMNVAEVLHPGCVIIDLVNAAPVPGMLLRLLSLRPAELQIILVGSQDTQSCDVIDALRAGAADYLIYPFTGESLTQALHKASQALAECLAPKTDVSHALRERLRSLPIREREVFLGLVGGGTNKSIARKLKLSPRTVEVHRAHLMQRLNVRTLTELLHLAHDAGVKGSA